MRDAAPDGAEDVALITFSADAKSLELVWRQRAASAAYDEELFRCAPVATQ